MRAEIVCIGTELLLGQTVDTNSAFLSRELAELGIDLYYKSTVGDNLQRIVEQLGQSWSRSDVLIISGGLGPTRDDLTREAVAELLREPLEFREDAWDAIQVYFDNIQRPVKDNNRRQAMFPTSARMLPNPVGTAPGIFVSKAGKYLYAFPGVPGELEKLWGIYARPQLAKVTAELGQGVLTSMMVRMVGIGESVMEAEIMDLITGQSNPTLAPYVGKGDIYLRITAKGVSAEANHHQIESQLQQVKARLGPYIYGYDQDTLEKVIGEQLNDKGWTLAVAESCTGGLIGHRITNVPGSSRYYLGGVGSYSNRLKRDILGVSEEILNKFGAVSAETAAAMAKGIKKITGADFSLAVTGIAGPDGGSDAKPVGLVFLGVNAPGYVTVERRIFAHDRIGNKEAAAQAGLELVWKTLRRFKEA